MWIIFVILLVITALLGAALGQLRDIVLILRKPAGVKPVVAFRIQQQVGLPAGLAVPQAQQAQPAGSSPSTFIATSTSTTTTTPPNRNPRSQAMPTQQPVIGIKAGSTGVFTATGVDSTGAAQTLPTGVIPQWGSSDTVNAPVTASVDGLTVSVIVLATAPVGTTFQLSVIATLADGTTPTGSTAVPFLAGTPAQVVSFVITQAS